MTIWLPLEKWDQQRPFRLWLYSGQWFQTGITLQPVRISRDPDWNPRWEEWHCYLFPLSVGTRDYQQMLAGYFSQIYPTRDAFDGTPEQRFDPCGPNWLGAEDWEKMAQAIRGDMDGMSAKRRRFYDAFLRWLEAALRHTSIIVAEGD